MLPENSILPDLESSSGDATMQNASSSFADTQKTHIKETILSKNLFFVEQQYADLSDLNNKMTRVKVDFASRSFCATLLSVLQGLLEASGLTSVVALNLSKNRIFTFRYVPEATSEVLFKSVKFLNLENNEFHRIAELLEYLKKKFPLLEHLSLLGNDELLRHAQSDKKVTGTSLLIPERLDFLFTYCQTILKTLPNIQVLDQIPVLQFIRELLLGTPQLPLLSAPLRGSWFDLPATAETVQSFITQFFTFYDSRRMDLGQIYDEDSILAISSVSLQFLKERNAGLYRQASIYLWMEYMKQNRTSLPNLFSLLGGSSIKGSASTSFLYKGAKEIGLFVNQYPPTRHLLESFIVDCWQSMEPLSKLDLPSESSGQTTPTLSILLYGKYQEQVDGAGALIAEREFLRVFVLIPSKSGSIGQVAGWPVRVLMDRIYLLNPPIENAAIPVPTLPLLYSPAELEALQGLSETKRTLVESFSQTTQLTLLFALECLTQNHWVLEDAQKAYTILKSKRKFPKNAFKSSI